MTDFDLFWTKYPRRVGKIAAEKAFVRATRHATPAAILAGVEQYCAHCPDEMQFIAHPATWLNQGRWMDEYDAPAKPLSIVYPCPHASKCPNSEWCRVVQLREKAKAS